MEKKIKDYIVRETASFFPDKDMGPIVEMFWDVLLYPISDKTLQGVNSRIPRALNSLVNEKHDIDSLSNLYSSLNKVEQYARKMLVIIDGPAYQSIVEDRGGFGAVQDALCLGMSANKAKKMREIRNDEGHLCVDWTLGEFYSNIAKLLKAYLDITEAKYDKLSSIIHKGEDASDSLFFPSQYINDIISNYNKSEANGFKYMDLHWINGDGNEDNNIESLTKRIVKKDLFAVKMLGEAGAGKSTALKRMEVILSKAYLEANSNPIPIYVPLNELSEGTGGLYGFIAKKIQCSLNELEEIMKEKNTILLLDGYNEILDNQLQRSLAIKIDNEARFYFKTKIVISDRTVSRGSLPILSDAEKYHLKKIPLEVKLSFFKSKASKHYDLIDKKAQEQPGYFESLDTPYKMQQFIELINEKGEIPNNLTEAYLNSLIERERNEKKELEMRDIEDFLKTIAIFLDTIDSGDEETKSIKEIQLQSKFAEIRPLLGVKTDVKRLIDLIVSMNIMIRENDGFIHFYSRDYQNYFMIKGIEDDFDIIAEKIL